MLFTGNAPRRDLYLDQASDWYRIDEVIIHEDYNEETNANDLALLRTERPIEFVQDAKGYRVNSICLPPPTLQYHRKIATATGWGNVQELDVPERLQKVDLFILYDWSCEEIYELLDLEDNWHEKIMLCAYGDGKDTKRVSEEIQFTIKSSDLYIIN